MTLVVLALVPILVLCVMNRFIPGVNDLKDPLGRPSDLSNDIIYSASQFDVITGELDPKHKDLSQSIQVLTLVAGDLRKLTDAAGRLSGLAISVNDSTTGVSGIAGGLPAKIQQLTQRSDTAGPTVLTLAGSIQAVTDQLETVNVNLKTVGSTLATLGPRADSIAAVLATIEEEAAHVAELGPLLALLGPAVNGPQTPAPRDPGRPITPPASTAPPVAAATPGR
ncbi:hypothetical protein [Gordonia sp. OPL2]|uniref:hypothetical protein n=1 Tax=Gordonia sp. OPL2 TaxID=2486274 RepID=UPI0021CD0C88|nr:hypothetical protein [Gordonia sp. OPL2]